MENAKIECLASFKSAKPKITLSGDGEIIINFSVVGAEMPKAMELIQKLLNKPERQVKITIEE